MIRFLKGHGTENDFVLLPDDVPLDEELVRALCDRRAGIGADGVIVGSAFVRVLLDHPDDRAAGLRALSALTKDLADGVRRG